MKENKMNNCPYCDSQPRIAYNDDRDTNMVCCFNEECQIQPHTHDRNDATQEEANKAWEEGDLYADFLVNYGHDDLDVGPPTGHYRHQGRWGNLNECPVCSMSTIEVISLDDNSPYDKNTKVLKGSFSIRCTNPGCAVRPYANGSDILKTFSYWINGFVRINKEAWQLALDGKVRLDPPPKFDDGIDDDIPFL
jgi:hypothetical protein